MKTPRLLLGVALLFWGWQTGMLLWAAPMALLLEASQFIRARWEFSLIDLKRIWNLCAVLFFGMGFILYSSEEPGRVALRFVQWLPLPFFPIILAQVYGATNKIPLSVFSWFLRRKPETALAQKTINISLLYFGLTLLAASATSQPNPFFYPGAVLLIGLALLVNRPKRLPQPLWIVLIAGVAFAGHLGHQQLHILHSNVEGALARWLVSMFSRRYNLDESRTAIGRVGRVRLSGEIVLRVTPESPNSTPGLLRDASYDIYRNGVWRGSQNDFTRVLVDTNDVAVLQPAKKLKFSVRIASYLRRGSGPLALPQGAFELSEFPALLDTNKFGVAKANTGPGLLNLVAHFGPGKTIDAPPENPDLYIPDNELAIIAQVAQELDLDGKTAREKIQTIGQFFQNNFNYSLEITRKHLDRSGEKTPLGQFLTVARSGHCEYFASAAVLLLRAADIPARYATGYLVDESTRKGKTFLVRERDAHAWVLTYRADKEIWEEFDPTPTSDRAQTFGASNWESFSDFLSNLKFQFSKWRWGKSTYTDYLKWLLLPLILFLLWRIVFSKRRQHKNDSFGELASFNWPGMDSEFYLLEEKMTAAGLGRRPDEFLDQWQERLSATVPAAKNLDQVFAIHRRLRFDPIGVTAEERSVLKSSVTSWLRQFEAMQKIEGNSTNVARV